MKIVVDRGAIISANYGIISFLWKNWEIYDRLLGSNFNISRISKNEWKGEKYGITAKIELVNYSEKEGEGQFNYIITASKFGISTSTSFKCIYTASKSKQTSVNGQLEVLSKGIVGFFMNLGVKHVQTIADEIIDGGRKSCELIQSNFNEIIGKLSEKDSELLKRNYNEGIFNQNIGSIKSNNKSSALKDDISALKARVIDLEKLLNRELTEIKNSFDVYSIDPALALASLRKIVETFARKLLVKHTKINPGSQELGKIIVLLNKEVNEIPINIIKSMKVVSEYGNLGIHTQTESKPRSNIGKIEFEISLSAGLQVIEWYFSNYE